MLSGDTNPKVNRRCSLELHFQQLMHQERMGEKLQRKPSRKITQILANNLRAFRKAKNLSQEELADRCNVHRTYLGSIERGERNATLSTLEALSAVGVSVPQLLTKRAIKDDG